MVVNMGAPACRVRFSLTGFGVYSLSRSPIMRTGSMLQEYHQCQSVLNP